MRAQTNRALMKYDRKEYWWSFLSFILTILMSMVPLFAFEKFLGSKSSIPQVFSKTALAFVAGIIVLALITVGVATIIRRQNREAIFLKLVLADIYISALKKSALNPQLKSLTPHD